ncbi:MAG: hypothetical protein R3220_09485, partial [Balneolaceae bacterium]|nr:hypothetical protein [Balneolaceae bacterium]
MSKNQKGRPVKENKNPESESSDGSLQHLGFDEWFRNRSQDFLTEDFKPARIIEVNKNNYKVGNGRDETVAECSGK